MANQDYLRNVWYVAALGTELGDELMRRVILDDPILLFRDSDTGEPAALLDRCPHRFAPLSMGQRTQGGVQCGYHGLVFASSGQCILNPHGNGRILPSAKVRSFPVVERYGLIWIWMGELALADDALVPDFGYLETADQRTRGAGYLPTAANYQLLTDNILDLSHADFLHPMLDSAGGVRLNAPQVEERGRGVIDVGWSWGPAPTMGVFSHLFEPDDQVFTSLSVRWYAPGVMHLRLATAPTRGGLANGMAAEAMHLLTPETAMRTHYFYGGVRNYDLENHAYTLAFAEGVKHAFGNEDKPMIEAIQANIGMETDIFALRPLGLVGDAGGVRIREALKKLIVAEKAGTTNPPAPSIAHVEA